ncbi:MAG: D-aminoacylase [Saprospiraceae bacterium]|nr:D-aminoacylase [Saprospiraceae bacterium]
MKRFSFLAILICLASLNFAQNKFDLIIKNAKIIDGSGNPWYNGDVGIRKGKITQIGNLDIKKAKQVIDAQGQIVAPGFIDVHAHVEGSIQQIPTADNFLFDGVTTLVTGNCGGSEVDLKTFYKNLEQNGISLNITSLVGHNSVRREAMGSDNREPTAAELQKMRNLVEQAMRDGAVGLSTGLIYVPGTFAKTDEIVELAKVASEYGGVYASHIRNEDDKVFNAIAEAVEIGKQAKLPVEISHFKITGKNEWGKSTSMIEQVLQYRAEGIDVTVDQYPYTASSTGLDVLLPTWCLAGGYDSLNVRLANPTIKAQIVGEMHQLLAKTGFGNYSYSVVANCNWEPNYNGKNISEINISRGNAASIENEIETILEMMQHKTRIQMIYHKMGEEDVQRIMQFPYAMIASDAGIPAFGRGAPHPRAYGTNSRVLGHYTRDLGILRLEDAIRKMTSLPAKRFNLHDRGLIAPGMAADIVIFDPNTIADKATFENSHAYAEGMSYVLVNGKPVIEKGTHNQAKPGKTLKGPGFRKKVKKSVPKP